MQEQPQIPFDFAQDDSNLGVVVSVVEARGVGTIPA